MLALQKGRENSLAAILFYYTDRKNIFANVIRSVNLCFYQKFASFTYYITPNYSSEHNAFIAVFYKSPTVITPTTGFRAITVLNMNCE